MTDNGEVAEITACSSGGTGLLGCVREIETVDKQKKEIIESLSNNKRIIFKSQQVSDPDLTEEEKRNIVLAALNDNYSKFLIRFGRYLSSKQLKFFEVNANQSEGIEDCQLILRDLRRNLRHKERNVRNRRFAAIKSMSVQDGYFSEREMMRREPHLYERLVGQFLTDSEKHVRDGVESKDTPFSQVLFNGIDRKHVEELRKEQENDDASISSDENESNSKEEGVANSDEELYPEVPLSSRRHWGDFETDDNPGIKPKAKKKQEYITAGEREMLRQEFIGIMHSKFIEGRDIDFDYSEVDENSDLDDFDQINRDNEDKYFDEEEGESSTTPMECDESDDELDIYMRNLNKNVSAQNGSNP